MKHMKTKINWANIKTLSIIPSLSCKHNCQGCYLRKMSFGEQLGCYQLYMRAADLARNELHDSLEEILLDLNEHESNNDIVNQMQWFHFMRRGIEREIGRTLRVLITTTPELAIRLSHIPLVKFSISIHTAKDVDTFMRMYNSKNREKIVGVSVLYGHKVPTYEIPADVNVYLLIDKYSKDWKNYVNGTPGNNAVATIQKLFISDGERAALDNCILTVMNKQECPAFSQINLYGDGSLRQCPYMIEEQTCDSDEFSHGCKLVTELREHNFGNSETISRNDS